jgi:oxygen-independent coproporphyrinogen III oxidase
MAGIYLHIPFCKKACHYCDFHFSTSWKYKKEMLETMHRELELQKSYLTNQTIETIYFGGGTPSILEPEEIRALIDKIGSLMPVSSNPEITLEANPDDLDSVKVKGLKQTSINRFSIGIQSFFEEDLRWMNRAHSANEAESSIMRVQDAGFENITLDLIYGYPLLTNEKWESNINKIISFEVPHVSAYSMTVEQRTALASFIKKGKQQPMNESQSAEQFQLLIEKLQKAGFEQYEISNFARPACYSRHNSNYWKGIPYLGIGPSAHSFNGETRQWNVANNAKYLDSLLKGTIPAELEILSMKDRVNEYIMTSLRTVWGLDLNKISKDFGSDYKDQIEEGLKEFFEKELVINREGIVTLTSQGKLFADHIASELFVEEM